MAGVCVFSPILLAYLNLPLRRLLPVLYSWLTLVGGSEPLRAHHLSVKIEQASSFHSQLRVSDFWQQPTRVSIVSHISHFFSSSSHSPHRQRMYQMPHHKWERMQQTKRKVSPILSIVIPSRAKGLAIADQSKRREREGGGRIKTGDFSAPKRRSQIAGLKTVGNLHFPLLGARIAPTEFPKKRVRAHFISASQSPFARQLRSCSLQLRCHACRAEAAWNEYIECTQ